VYHGTRQLQRGLDGMTVPTLFAHQYNMVNITDANWRAIMQGIRNNIASYQPQYVTLDYACQYARAMHTSNISASLFDSVSRQITTTLSGQTDMPTKFYLFTEPAGQIQHEFINAPTFSGSKQVVATFSASKLNQTITFNSLPNKVYGDPPFTVSATASSGLAVTFTASGTCSSSGANGATITLTGAGSCTVTAHQAGNANYNPASDVSQTFTIAKANQTITFNSLSNKVYGDPPFTVAAAASSGLAVTFTVSGPCSSSGVNGATVTLTGAGSCAVTAHQAGNTNYNPALDVARTFTIAKANQTITFNSLSNKVYGDPPFTVAATASSGLAVTFTVSGGVCSIAGATVTLTGAGSCTVTAHQDGDTNYNPASDVAQPFTIAKANQTIAFGTLPNKTYGNPPFTVSATASSGLAVTFTASGACSSSGVNGATVTLTGVGSCTVTAHQAGNANYNPAPDVAWTFTIAKANQTITFNPLPDKVITDPPFTAAATASSGLAVTFTASGACSVAGSTITLRRVGSCTVTAHQAGNANYHAAPDVVRTFTTRGTQSFLPYISANSQ
jgi:hypothetical protein